ncbi:MAG TPA: MFS transporter [Alphaproteobacteria bacterium]
MAETTPDAQAQSQDRDQAKTFTGFGGAIAAMSVPAYRDFTIANTISLTGTWLQKLATGWLVWELTQSPSWLGIITFVDLGTQITVGPLAGALADRVSRQRLMVVAQVVMMAQALAIAVFYMVGWVNIWLLVALTVLLSSGQGTHTAARNSLIPNLVPKGLLAPAIGINALTFNLARFMGPAAAGGVIGAWGLSPAFVLNALSYLPFMYVLWRLRIVTPDDIRPSGDGLFAQIAEGMSYVRHHPGIGPLTLIMGVTAFSVRALPDMLPGFSAEIFSRGAEGLAWLTCAMGLGAAVGGAVLARTNGTDGLTRRLAWNVGCMSLAILAFVATRNFTIGLIAAAACGYVMTTNGATSQTLIQSAVEGAVRGRVMATFTLIYQGAPALGGLILGYLAEYIGLRPAFACGAALCFCAFLWMLPRSYGMGAALETGRAAKKP